MSNRQQTIRGLIKEALSYLFVFVSAVFVAQSTQVGWRVFGIVLFVAAVCVMFFHIGAWLFKRAAERSLERSQANLEIERRRLLASRRYDDSTSGNEE